MNYDDNMGAAYGKFLSPYSQTVSSVAASPLGLHPAFYRLIAQTQDRNTAILVAEMFKELAYRKRLDGRFIQAARLSSLSNVAYNKARQLPLLSGETEID